MKVLSGADDIKAFKDLLSKGDVQALAELKTPMTILDTSEGTIIILGSGGAANNDEETIKSELKSIMPNIKVNRIHSEDSAKMGLKSEPALEDRDISKKTADQEKQDEELKSMGFSTESMKIQDLLRL